MTGATLWFVQSLQVTFVTSMNDENDILYNIVYMYQNGDEKDMNEEKEECRIEIDRLKYSIVDSEEINEW